MQTPPELTKAQESRMAIEKLYVEMRHIFNRGRYNPLGASGSPLRQALQTLNPEIYGSINDPEKVEMDGLVYVIDRLPKGIEQTRFIKLTSDEGFGAGNFGEIIPPKRRRNCYRIDKEQLFIEVTRGRSEIYDILTHLTFLYNEAEKIKQRAIDYSGEKTREWLKLEEIITGKETLNSSNLDKGLSYISVILGRTFGETKDIYFRLQENAENNNGLFHLVYWMGKIASEAREKPCEISFSPALRERIGRHIYGERWAKNIKRQLYKYQLHERPIHIISANLHSIMNCLYASTALQEHFSDIPLMELAKNLSKEENAHLRQKVSQFAKQNGMIQLQDTYGTNISVQIFDTAQIPKKSLPSEIQFTDNEQQPVLIVMDYAFGEQAYETMDELLKPYSSPKRKIQMPVTSISIMGKAGILQGVKGDIMIPTAHVFEGTADNYPFENDFKLSDFEGYKAFEGAMITVLGTSLQNKDVLAYFKDSSWRAVGLEMEGAHYQKAIQSASHIRGSIHKNVRLRYAYYASDNPLITGGTLASGGLGMTGVKPTYLITTKILNKIFES